MRASPAPAFSHALIGQSPAIAALRARVPMLARSFVPLLILGDTGTGKEAFAQAVFDAGRWAPCVHVNCAALPESIVDAELFGYERGAFTGAVRSHAGLLAQADGGVLFLDELAELPLQIQAKLLRAFDSGEYRALGSARTLRSSFRLVLATNGDIDRLCREHRLRADFMHRLGGLRVTLPPLRSRMEDVPLLARHFLAQCCGRDADCPGRIADDALAVLLGHSWPGNVRELRNVVRAAAALAWGANAIESPHVMQVLVREPSARGGDYPDAGVTLAEATREAEERAIREALLASGGARDAAAQRLGISPATLYRKLARIEDGDDAPGDGERDVALAVGRPLASRAHAAAVG